VRGRKPKSTAQKIAEGDPRKQGVGKLQEQLGSEPKPSRGLPDCPAHLGEVARRAWLQWSMELQIMDQDRRPDAHALEAACIAYESAVQCYETIQKPGRFIPKKARAADGSFVVTDIKSHPAVRQLNAALLIERSFCSEFGFTPASRTRLRTEKPEAEEDDLMALLSEPRKPKGTVQ
jgi:P27 family predicted phage terminase small subunit